MNIEDNNLKIKNWQRDILATFCTVPQNSYYMNCFIGEFIGTFVLVLCVELSSKVYPENVPFFMGIVLFTICLAIGGATGNAVNPVRDFVPRLCHQFFRIKYKGDSMWKYSIIPIIGPIIGGICGALLGNAFLKIK
jgi:glycerol uptake facilitator protein